MRLLRCELHARSDRPRHLPTPSAVIVLSRGLHDHGWAFALASITSDVTSGLLNAAGPNPAPLAAGSALLTHDNSAPAWLGSTVGSIDLSRRDSKSRSTFSLAGSTAESQAAGVAVELSVRAACEATPARGPVANVAHSRRA